MKRKAFLLKHVLHEHENFTTDLDFDLVKCFLQSAEGGCFVDSEIVEYNTSAIRKDFLLHEIADVDYSFIYFSGHSSFHDRLVYLPMLDDHIKESELILPNKKQWIFLDCCRTNLDTIPSPDFQLPRYDNLFTPSNIIAHQNWEKSISALHSFYMMYYTTQLNAYAYRNNYGGFGTQLFFMMLMEKTGTQISLRELVQILHQNTIQQSDLIAGNIEAGDFSFISSIPKN